MRLLKLSFKNLNSLVGTWSIDFDEPAYRNEGIFAISGPTGAGKSTLLDAICLALYKASPRLKEITKTSNEMMSRGTGDCFSELTFAAKGRILTARFAQSRARSHAEGALQDASWTLSENGRIRSEKARDTKIQIEEILGLDFEQFTRAILLAQGNFAAFLKASPAEQADLLEKMTGTEIYQQIGEEIHAITAEKRQELEHFDTLLGNHISLSDEQRSELAAALEQQQIRLDELEKELKSLGKHQSWRQQIAAHEADFSHQENAVLAARQSAADLSAELTPILLQDAASRQLDLAAQIFHQQQAESQKLLVQKNQAELAASDAANALLKATETLRNTEAAGALRKLQWQADRLALQQLRESLQEEALAAGIAGDLAGKMSAADQAKKLAQEDLSKQQKNHELLVGEEQQTTLHLKNHAVDAGLASLLPLLNQQLQAWKAQLDLKQAAEKTAETAKKAFDQASLKQTKLSTETDKKRLELHAPQEALKLKEAARFALSAKQTEEALNDELRQLRQRLADFQQQVTLARQRQDCDQEKTALDQPLVELRLKLAGLTDALPIQKNLVADKFAAIEKEQERRRLLDRIASLEIQRQALLSGQPCPLCGAEEHPYAQHLPAAPEADTLRRVKAEHKAESQKLEVLTLQHTSATTEESLKNERRTAIENQLARLPLQDLAGLLVQLGPCEEAIHPVAAALQSQVDLRREVEILRPKVEASLSELQRLEEGLRQADSQVQQTELLLRQAQNDLTGKVLGRETQELELVAALVPFVDISPASLSLEVLPQLQARAQNWQRKTQSLQALALQLATATEQLCQASTRLANSEAELQSAAAALNTAQEAQESLRQSRLARFGNKEPDAAQISLDTDLEMAEKSLRDASTSHSSAVTAAGLATQRRDELQLAFEDGKNAQLAQEEQWRQNLAAAGFADDVARLAVQIPPAQGQEALSRLKDAAEAHAKARSLREVTQLRLEELRLETWPERSAEELARALQSLRESIAEEQQKKGADREKLAADELARVRHGSLLAQRQAAAADLLPWDLTKSCIDSKDGLKRFAQGLTLERLLGLANQHLLRLRPRYQLSRENELIRIIDTHHADAIRPIANLSGGESFLVSLSLALGLSDMASRQIELGCLFLDEGFGTLDGDSLQQALEALAHLQQHTGKLIGLISHIDGLKEVLHVQIKISPVGRGRSEISGPGVVLTAAAAPSLLRAAPLGADTHARALALLLEHTRLKSSLLQEKLELSPAQASKILKELVEKGLLQTEGKGKGMSYVASGSPSEPKNHSSDMEPG